MIGPGFRFGRYEVGERLGKGGFGVVHLAKDLELGRDIAIKFLRPEFLTRPHIVQRFLQEARAAAKIGHVGIVTVFELGLVENTGTRADGTAFIAMELLRGESLADKGRLPLATAIAITRQLAGALTAAHAAGIVHRDLKPDNVFLVDDPAAIGGLRVKLLDFGVAKLAEPSEDAVDTHSQIVLGTPRYMAPEQARSSKHADHRSDIYALGCMFYEMLCGHSPYSGDAGEQITKHQSAPIPSATARVPDLDPAIGRLLESMLAKSPAARPQSMTAIEQTLASITQAPRRLSTATQTSEREPSLEEATTLASAPAAAPTAISAALPSPHANGAASSSAVSNAPPPSRAGLPLRMSGAVSPSPTSDPSRSPLAPMASSSAPASSDPSSTPVPSPLAPEAATLAAPSPPDARPNLFAPLSSAPVGGAAGLSRRRTAIVVGIGLAAMAAVVIVGVVVISNAAKTSSQKPAQQAEAEPASPRATPSTPSVPAVELDAAAVASAETATSTTPSVSANEIAAECLDVQSRRDWTKLFACAETLKQHEPVRAEAFSKTATNESRFKAALEAADAISQRDPDAALTKLRTIPSSSVYFKDAEERIRVVNGAKLAARAVPPTPPATAPPSTSTTPATKPDCNAELLMSEGSQHMAKGEGVAGLLKFHAAYQCKPSKNAANMAFLAACTSKNAKLAKLYYSKITNVSLSQRCVANNTQFLP